MLADLAELERDMRHMASRKQMDIDRLLSGNRHQLGLKSQLRELSHVLDDAAHEVERCRDGLVETDREVKVLEKLYEQQLEEHEQAEASRDIKHLDEVASTAWQRKER